ncbi:hypothetical protein ACIRG5_19035 [Lentzea sp. NPDC102401]|uniref:hypothetical protein n=1 Tax=Lentzea sp. NPDC102401 TaxID=3364128 RepID=UPI00382690D3
MTEVVLIVVALASTAGLMRWGHPPLDAVALVLTVIIVVIAVARTRPAAILRVLVQAIANALPLPGIGAVA